MADNPADDHAAAIDHDGLHIPPRNTRVVAFVPITVALIGLAAIFLGSHDGSAVAVADRPALDPVTTGSVR